MKITMLFWMGFLALAAGGLRVAKAEDSAGIDRFLGGDETEISCRLTRVNVLFGAFAEFDLGIAALKVQPYVELRFNRR